MIAATLTLWLELVTTSAIAATVAGAMSGQFSVSPSGAATYNIPIELPPGVAGLAPTLALFYDSQGPVGVAGPGWSLSGPSYIARCPRSWAKDGTAEFVKLASTDRFCLDGHRLVLADTTKPYGADGAVYRVDPEVFSRVTSIGSAGFGPASFKVETKEGRVALYGATADSQIYTGPAFAGGAAPASPLLWAVNQISDASGNTIVYKWNNDRTTGSYSLDQIQYNGGKAVVKFSYAVDTDWARTVYVGGSRQISDRRLTGIAVSVVDPAGAQIPVRSYALTYSPPLQGAVKQAPRLLSVQECTSTGNCLPPISFGWSTGTSATPVLSSTALASRPACSDSNINAFSAWADINRDGQPDLFCFGQNGVTAYLSQTGGGFDATGRLVSNQFGYSAAAGGWTTSDGQPRYLIDMNRDGYPDLVGFHFQGSEVAFWNPASQTFSAPVAYPSMFGSTQGWYSARLGDAKVPRRLVDVNRDGYPDIVGFSFDGKIYLSLWNGSTFSTPVVSGVSAVPGVALSDADMTQMADMNGDGLQDVVYFASNGVYVAYFDPVTSRFGTPVFTGLNDFVGGTGQAGGTTGGWANLSNNPRYLLDMNADGLPDIVGFTGSGGAKVSLWDGTRFLPSTMWVPAANPACVSSPCVSGVVSNPSKVVDSNGDGYPDFAFTDGASLSTLALSNGHGGVLASVAIGKVVEFRDITGDGFQDALTSATMPSQWYVINGPTPHRIARITGSLGNAIDISYGLPLAKSSLYAFDGRTTAWPDRDVLGYRSIVAQTSVDDGLGGKRITTYRYAGARWNQDYGDLGYSSFAARDAATQLETTTYFSQVYPFINRVASVERRVASALTTATCPSGADSLCYPTWGFSSGQLLERTAFQDVSEDLGPDGEYASAHRLFVYNRQIDRTAWDLDGSAMPSKTTQYAYEEPALVAGRKQWGNLTKTTVSASDGPSTVTQVSYYAPDEAHWILGKPQQAVTTAIRPAKTFSAEAQPNTTPPPTITPAPAPASTLAALATILQFLLAD